MTARPHPPTRRIRRHLPSLAIGFGFAVVLVLTGALVGALVLKMLQGEH